MRITARLDPELSATLVTARPLRFGSGEDPSEDRPAHVRAASGLTHVGDRLAIVQDDSNFIILVDPRVADVRYLPLPRGPGGARQFDDDRGNKRFKLDLESCTAVPSSNGTAIIAFGSGSTAEREQVAWVVDPASDSARVELRRAQSFYLALRAETRFSGSQLNLEGVIYEGGRIRLINRGNGARRDGLVAINATVDLDWKSLERYLLDPLHEAVPPLLDVTTYELGWLDGVPLGFTDAAALGSSVLYTAAAEISPDVTLDGPVVGSAIGIISGDSARWTPLRTADGELFGGKVEGITIDPKKPGTVYLVVDRDDPAQASELCVAALAGPWL
ncbi:MAG: DUF6929 family protein [Longimicrobiales bacterium]